MAEVVKYGVIRDAEFFAYLEERAEAIFQRLPDDVGHIIKRSCELKAEVVLDDERETTGLRAILNYGHTFAHAYENLLGYGSLLHGEAVAVGMLHASRLAEALGRIEPVDTQRQQDLLERLELPTALPERLSVDDVIEVMRSDKKTEAGRLRFVLPSRIGHVELVDSVDEQIVRSVLQSCLAEVEPPPA